MDCAYLLLQQIKEIHIKVLLCAMYSYTSRKFQTNSPDNFEACFLNKGETNSLTEKLHNFHSFTKVQRKNSGLKHRSL